MITNPLFSLGKTTNISNRSYFKKLPIWMILHIQSYLSFSEQATVFKLSTEFQKRSPFLSFRQQLTCKRQAIQYMLFLAKLDRDSGDKYTSYLNYFMSINMFSIPSKYCCSVTFEDKITILTSLIQSKYLQTGNNKFKIELLNMKSYELYLSVMSQLPFLNELRISMTMAPKLMNEVTQNISLYNIINLKRLNTENNIYQYSHIQQEIFKQKIKAFHYKVYDTSEVSLKKAIKYFKLYPNHLYSITNATAILAQYNESSITTIIKDFHHPIPSEFKNIKVQKLKGDYPSYKMCDEFLNVIQDYSQITTFGSFEVNNKTECNYLLLIINSMPQLNCLSMIHFQYIEDKEQSSDLFMYFGSNINKNTKLRIQKLKFCLFAFKTKEVYAYLQNEFPNLRVLTSYYNMTSSIEMRFEIENVFSTYNGLQDYEMRFIVFLLKNNMRIKQRRSFKFILYDDVSPLVQFINYLHQEKEEVLLNSIDTIDNKLSINNNISIGYTLLPIRELSKFDIKNSNIGLIPLLKAVEKIREITVYDEQLFIDYYDFIMEKQPNCLVYLGANCMGRMKQIENIKSIKDLVVPVPQIKDIKLYYSKPRFHIFKLLN